MLDVVQHWVPVPGQPVVVVVNCSTPCLALGDELAGLFEAIARSLEFLLPPN